MVKSVLHRFAVYAERLFDRLIPGGRGAAKLEAYRGYATPEHLILRGRVLTKLRHIRPNKTQGHWRNAKAMISLFLTDEVPGVEVTLSSRDATGVSDEEGYVTLRVPRQASDGPGWVELCGEVAGSVVPFSALVPRSDARWGVISDVDDTVIETGAYSLTRNLWTTFTGNALTRHVFDDSVALIERLSDAGRNPIFYVSSSPWNLYAFLDMLFSQGGLTRGPMFLRDLGISDTQFIAGTHGNHKGRAIDTILAANPGLGFVLMGDTGQHDAEVYRDAIARHPGRIRAVVLRQPGPGPKAASAAAMDEIRGLGVPLFSDRDFTKLTDEIMAAMT